MLVTLAFVELGYNLSNVFCIFLLGYIMDQMTNEPCENFKEPIFNQDVPFFVHLASVKLLNDYLINGDDL